MSSKKFVHGIKRLTEREIIKNIIRDKNANMNTTKQNAAVQMHVLDRNKSKLVVNRWTGAKIDDFTFERAVFKFYRDH